MKRRRRMLLLLNPGMAMFCGGGREKERKQTTIMIKGNILKHAEGMHKQRAQRVCCWIRFRSWKILNWMEALYTSVSSIGTSLSTYITGRCVLVVLSLTNLSVSATFEQVRFCGCKLGAFFFLFNFVLKDDAKEIAFFRSCFLSFILYKIIERWKFKICLSCVMQFLLFSAHLAGSPLKAL